MSEKKIITETDRLILRRYCKEDLQDLYEYLSDEEVVKYEPYKPMNRAEVEENLDWRISTDEMIAVVRKENNKMIGNVYLGKRDFESLEIGYVFNKDYWGQGYAKESCNALIRKSFSEGIHRIFAECDPCNAASWKLLENLGLKKEAHFEKNVYFWKDENGNPIWKDTFVYSLLNKECNNDCEWLDTYLRSFPCATKDFKEEWQWIRYQVGDKMFAAICKDATGKRDIITIKLDAIEGDFLRQQYKDIVPGHYMNKTHWNSIYLDGEVPIDMMKELIEKSYYLVVKGLTKKKQKEILGES